MKWYEESGSESSVVVASRIRLVRNLKAYRFPGMLNEEEASELTKELFEKLKKLSSVDGRTYEECRLADFDELHREALQERQIINRISVADPRQAGLLLSKDEAVSVTVNSVDHVRMQISKYGMELQQVWGQMDKLDDCVNEMYPYAFDNKLGYMTTYPTNVGTGMKAYLILHLALLDSVAKFPEILSEIGRFGIKVRPAFGKKKENSGSLYVMFNQKTLGISEQEVIQMMEKIAGQLVSQEKSLRHHSIERHRIQAEDICYKAYGNLRYSRLMTLESGMNLLSQLRWGQEEQVISFEKYCNIYELMIGIQPANLSVFYDKPLKGEALERARAEYLQRFLPEIR